jgi:hypothetical protein
VRLSLLLFNATLVENEHEQAALKFANELRSKGESLHKIAAALEQNGFKARGKQWYAKSLARVLDVS